MNGWQPFSLMGLPVSPWRNGGGETRGYRSACDNLF